MRVYERAGLQDADVWMMKLAIPLMYMRGVKGAGIVIADWKPFPFYTDTRW